MVQSESIHFRKISSNKNYISRHKKAPKNCFKTDLKHLILELGNTNDCKEELPSFLCVETYSPENRCVFLFAWRSRLIGLMVFKI